MKKAEEKYAYNFTNKVVLVTGGTGALGSSISVSTVEQAQRAIILH